jgi:hypothetical protein
MDPVGAALLQLAPALQPRVEPRPRLAVRSLGPTHSALPAVHPPLRTLQGKRVRSPGPCCLARLPTGRLYS